MHPGSTCRPATPNASRAEGAVTSVGSRGDSYDHATAESIMGLYKRELISMRGPWRTVDDVELATLAWVHWVEHRATPLGYR
jgi:putative transposase